MVFVLRCTDNHTFSLFLHCVWQETKCFELNTYLPKNWLPPRIFKILLCLVIKPQDTEPACPSLGGQGYPGIPGDTQGYPGIPGDPRGYPGIPGDTRVYPGIPGDTRGYPGIPGDTRVYPGIPGDTRGYPGTRRATIPRPSASWADILAGA